MNENHVVFGPLKSLAVSLLISASLVAPFMALELINQGSFPFMLFAFMSVHSLLIVLLVTPALRRLYLERRLGALKLGHWAGLLLGAFLGYAYAGVVIDQLPCFLGVANCD